MQLAPLINGEILSVDSMAVYRHMDIGTAKPSAEDRAAVPHHLIDLIDPDQEFSLSEFVRHAHAAYHDVKQRGKTPIFVGGTPLYLKSLLRGMFVGPPADVDFRNAIQDEANRVGVPLLHQRVQQIDPLSAHRILPNDLRRLTRVLEVYRATGKPMSHWQNQFDRFPRRPNARFLALIWNRQAIHQRVNERATCMMKAGLVDEVRTLMTTFANLSRTALQAVGYKEVVAFLNGEWSEATALEKIQTHSRQFVRRQDIWFRSMPELLRVSTDARKIECCQEWLSEIVRSAATEQTP